MDNIPSGGGVSGIGRKDQILAKLSDRELFWLAESAVPIPIDSKKTRSDLIEMIKEALSIEEIQTRRTEAKIQAGGVSESIFEPGKNGQVLLAVLMVISILGYSTAFTNPALTFLVLTSFFSTIPMDTHQPNLFGGVFVFLFLFLGFI